MAASEQEAWCHAIGSEASVLLKLSIIGMYYVSVLKTSPLL